MRVMTETQKVAVQIGNLAAIRAGGKRALSEALALVEQGGRDPRIAGLIDEAYLAPHGAVIGLTGPPGVGKSTLIDSLIRKWRAAGVTVGVIAVDPSSRVTRGALLGDRIRMRTDPEDQGVFVRSLASRGRLGGLAELAFPAVVLMRAIYDRVLVETVGVGQSEADISTVADTVILCIQPGSGDSIQFMKAGIMEIPDIVAVTKADIGPSAQRALADVKGALGLANSDEIPCLKVSALKSEGLDELLEALNSRQAKTGTEELWARRRAQASGWLQSALLQHFGEEGLKAAQNLAALPEGSAPFGYFNTIAEKLRVSFDADNT